MQKNLLDQGLTAVPVSVNVSRQLLYDKTFADDYCNYITKIGIPVNLIEIEITESALFEDIDLFRSTLEKLRNFGFRILMDDFGTGYSSLNHVRELPIDIIKIDRCFVENLSEDDFAEAFVKMVSELAKTIGVSVCVEGVEQRKQLEVLNRMNVNMIQGYYYGKPMTVKEFEKIYL